MREVLDQLPKAVFWSGTLMWLTGVSLVLCLLLAVYMWFTASPVLGIGMLLFSPLAGIQFYFLRNYKLSCQLAMESEKVIDLEEACYKQKALLLMFGVLVLLSAIFSVIIAFLVIASL